jgi:transmembrane sensor
MSDLARQDQDTIDQAAADWDARLRAPGAIEADRTAFNAWREADPSNAEAFDRLQGVLAGLRAAAERPELRALRDEARAGVRKARARRWTFGLTAAAATVAAVMVVAGVGLQSSLKRPSTPASVSGPIDPDARIYRTALNERSTVTLEDGSTVTLDSASRIAARFEPGRRSITLMEGQALFHVSKDPTRPFVVRAGDRTVTALGTIFDVRLDGGRMKVTLIEGKVAVRSVGGGAGGGEQVLHVLAPRQQLVELVRNETPIVRIVDTGKATSWTEGRIFLEDEPLGQAVGEMNRYSSTRLVVADASIAGLRINGMFHAGNQMGFVGALQATLPIEARTDDQGRILLERRAASSN